MSEKLTHKEHATRAMLMGRVYDWRDGTYCLGVDDKTGMALPDDMIDAVTLEEVHHRSVTRRMGYSGTHAGEPWETPKRETPWARMDDD